MSRPKAADRSHEGMVVVTVPTFMRSEYDWYVTARTLDGLLDTVPADHTILVVDDASPDQRSLKAMLSILNERLQDREVPQYWQYVSKYENQGFANSVNYGLRTALENKMHCLLVNADMEFPDEHWFDTMMDTEGWVVGAKLLYPTGLIQHAGVYFSVVTRTFDHLHKFGPSDLHAANFKRKCPVTGALQLIRYDTIKAVGLYDENFTMGWEDVDYCLRVFYAGGDCIYNPEIVALHHESVFRGNKDDKIIGWMQDSFRELHAKHAGRNFGEFIPMLIGQDPTAGSI